MNETKYDWNDLKLFLAVARSKGLAGAAKATGKSPPTLSRRMLALESATGSELFIRLPRGYELTDDGAALFEKLLNIESQIDAVDISGHANVNPLVKVSAGSWMTFALCQRIADIVKPEESIRLRFISAEQVLDISRRETLIGIRNQRPEQAGLATRNIGRVHFAGYAVSKEVTQWVRVLGNTPSARWTSDATSGTQALEVSAPRNALDIARSGAARAVLPTFVGDDERTLMRVTPPIAELAHDQWLVSHQDERFRTDVRLVIDRLYEVARSLHDN